jgi:hypothetical protein
MCLLDLIQQPAINPPIVMGIGRRNPPLTIPAKAQSQ